MAVEVIGTNQLVIDGYVYKRDSRSAHRTFWNCIRKRKNPTTTCVARASTTHVSEGDAKVSVFRGPAESPHSHPPNPKEVEMVRTPRSQIKKQAGTDSCKKTRNTRSMKNPRETRRGAETPTKKLSRNKKPMAQDLCGVSDLGDPQTTAFAFVESAQCTANNDVDPLSSSLVTSSAPSSPLASSTDADRILPSVATPIESSTPITRIVYVDNVQKGSVRHSTSIKKKEKTKRVLRNEKLIKLLSSTIETTFKTIQHFSEIMAAKKDKKKKKKKKKDRSEKQQKSAEPSIMPPVPPATPIEDSALLSSLPTDCPILKEELNEEHPVVDLTNDVDVEIGDIGGNQSKFSFESTVPEANSTPNVLISNNDQSVPNNDYYLPPYELATNTYMPRNHYDFAPPVAHHFMYQAVTVQQLDTRIEHRNWTLNDMRVPLQNFRQDNNGFVADLPPVAELYCESRFSKFSYGPVGDCKYLDQPLQ